MESPVECLWIDLVGDIKLKVLCQLMVSLSGSHAVMGMMGSSKEGHMPDKRRRAARLLVRLVLKVNMITALRLLGEGHKEMKDRPAIRLRGNQVSHASLHLHLHRKGRLLAFDHLGSGRMSNLHRLSGGLLHLLTHELFCLNERWLHRIISHRQRERHG